MRELRDRRDGGRVINTKQLYLFLWEAVGTNTDRTVYGAASASAASSFVVPYTQQISMAAGWRATPKTSTSRRAR